MKLLEIEDLQVHYGAIKAVQGLSLEIEEGQIATLIGANGAGKSSTLNAIAGLVPTAGGKIRFNNIDITGKPTDFIVRAGISQSMEGRQVFPRMSVQTNLELGGYTVSKNRMKENLKRAFEMFPRLEERKHQMAGTLSGGEQQMLAVARALMCEPKLLMLDEPSLGLAPIIVQELFAEIKRINKELGITILLVEQNARMALSISQIGYVIERGKIQNGGSAADLLNSESVVKAYLGG